jgi:hypothetical protein
LYEDLSRARPARTPQFLRGQRSPGRSVWRWARLGGWPADHFDEAGHDQQHNGDQQRGGEHQHGRGEPEPGADQCPPGTPRGQLAELRNRIRHRRAVDDVTRKLSEAAILWFRQVLDR